MYPLFWKIILQLLVDDTEDSIALFNDVWTPSPADVVDTQGIRQHIRTLTSQPLTLHTHGQGTYILHEALL